MLLGEENRFSNVFIPQCVTMFSAVFFAWSFSYIFLSSFQVELIHVSCSGTKRLTLVRQG